MRKITLASSQLSRTTRFRLGLDLQLEDRTVPVLGSPTWQALPLGPGNSFGVPLISGVQPGSSPVSQGPSTGAIRSVLVSPTSPDIIYAGTVNGGVWRTFNGTSVNPIWTPLTDSQASLAIGDLAFGFSAGGAVDTNTIYVGTGNFSSYASLGDPPAGVLKSTNGGATWTQLGATTFGVGAQVTVQSGATFTLNRGVDINRILPTLLGGGQIVLASTNLGLYRSTDGGSTWARVSGSTASGLPEAGLTDLIADPSNTASSSRFYAAVAGSNNAFGQAVPTPGIYVSSDGGQTWALTPGQPTGVAGTNRIRLTASNGGGGTTAVFAALVNASNNLSGVFRSADGGSMWASMSLPGDPTNPALGVTPGTQGHLHLSFAADPNNSTVVYIGGDRQPTYVFPYGWSGNIYRGDASQPAANVWTSVVLSGASGTAPHADSRNIAFDGSGNLIEADDGGLYKLTNPGTTSRVWTSLNGAGPTALQAYELTSIAYTQTNGTVLNGAQDNGSPAQNPTVSGVTLSTDLSGGDGQIVQTAYDPTTRISTQYSSAQNLAGFSRRSVNLDGSISSGVGLTLLVNGTTGGATSNGGLQTLRQVEGVTPRPANAAPQYANDPNGGIAFMQLYAANAVDPTRLMIATNKLYESTNQGDNLTQLTNLNGQATFPGRVTALAYGGRLNGVANADATWVGVDSDGAGSGQLYLRSAANGAFALVSSYTGAAAIGIATDPDNWQRAYILDARNQVWQTTDGGLTFTNLTTPALNALLPTSATPLLLSSLQRAFSIAVFPNTTTPGDEAIFVAGPGGVYGTDLTGTNQTSWLKFGTSLPNVAVTGLAYNASANVLVASTLGRGDWQVTNLSSFANAPAPVVTLNGLATNNSATFTQGGGAVALAPSATVTSTAAIQSIQLTITNVRNPGFEQLSATTNSGTNITSSYNSTTGVLTLSGADTTANYQQVLRTVVYNNTSLAPSTVNRIINVVATTAGANSQVAVNTLTVTRSATNQTPVVSLNGASGTDVIINFIANSGPTLIAPQATLSSPLTLMAVNLTLTNALDGSAESFSADTTGTSITASYTATTGILSLRGLDTAANYQQVLRTVRYNNTSPTPNTTVRKITVIAYNTQSGGSVANADIVVQLVNNAPVLDNSQRFALPNYTQGSGDPTGIEVNSFLGKETQLPRITDPDAGAVGGIAVITADQGNGTWQYSLDGGSTWVAFGTTSAAQALLLGDAEGNQIRFLPNAGFTGTATFLFRGWDQTNGSPNVQLQEADGAYGDTTQNGGSTAYSSAVATAQATVLPAPVSPPPVSAPPVTVPPPVSTPSGSRVFAVGADVGGAPRVQVYDSQTGALLLDFLAFSASFTGGVRTAVGDINGDGTDDIVCSAGPGGGPDVRVFDGKSGALIRQFMAFQPSFTGGVSVAVGDINKDGYSDIILGAGTGGGPRVRVIDGKTGSSLADFYAYTTAFTGGVTVASGDVNNDGFADIVTGTQTGAPHVIAYSGTNLSVIRSYYAYSPTFTGGVSVAAGDFNGDGFADIVTGAGAGGSPQVTVTNGKDGSLYGTFQAYNSSFTGGVRVAVVDASGGGLADIVTGPGANSGPQVNVFQGKTLGLLRSQSAFGGRFGSGLYVGGRA